MTDTKRRLGYLETISQPLALKAENLMLEYQAIWQVLKQADEATFYQLATHLFVTIEQKEPLLVEALESTPEGYELFKTLLKEGK
ncbi:lignostilbene-alpha,beta-dioxygenase [Streptococcus dysgalactiae subsp. equisimilis]|uniref:Lignostilbene-alpha,beta-dioxygenase n=2 Tax=Streptococcus dysgalactiae TaxID=1334 RepID=A0A9X8T0Z1_STREQ|nr:lignostilbene-alpha,beta-dioxygenase [Streptococcus dysgalactiae subsp. equisimilis]VEF04915.1 lignostilbene-alpha,beta-dioxygenase [Streptococcus dysgalactiae subsp. equisimilis]